MSEAYRQAGVDLAAKGPLVRRLAELARRTRRPGVLEDVGGFGGLFSLTDAGLGRLEDPVLVAGADGVGTKLRLLASRGLHRVAGMDVVAMCVNDVVACGAEPLFFLDYFAASRLEPNVVEAVVEGIAEACRECGCALLGGETAEMPGFYAPGEYELAGFCVGVAGRAQLLGPEKVRPGDRLVGLASNGLHANGFSLVRRVVEQAGVDLDAPTPWEPELRLAEALLQPTRLYARPLRAVMAAVEVHAAAHVTGGGLPDNLGRIVPAGMTARLRRGTWPEPPVFAWLAKVGGMAEEEMFRVFNMGLGMVLAVPANQAEMAVALLRAAGQQAAVVGEVVAERAAEGSEGSSDLGPSGEAPTKPLASAGEHLPGTPARHSGQQPGEARVLHFSPSAKRPGEGGRVEIVL